MANGDLVKLGTLYMGSTKIPRPTKPWRNDSQPYSGAGNGNIQNYSAGQALEIRDTASNDADKMQWIEVNDGGKKYLVADRVWLSGISWNDLDAQGLISGKNIKIDGQDYLLRVLTGGEERREGGSGTSYGGGKLPNEWDHWIENTKNLPGLPKPTSSDLATNAYNTAAAMNGAHNSMWNWGYMYSWCQDVYKHNTANRAFRGYDSARHFTYYLATYRPVHIGWRPALEVLNSAPLISGGQQNLGNKTGPFSVEYQVSDPEGDAVNVVEKINNTVIKTENNVTQGVNRTIKLTSEQWAAIPLNVASTITVEATDAKGAKSIRTYTFTKTNAAPTASAVEPLGDLANIAIVDNLTPIFVWAFSDTDPDDKQSAYQLVIEDVQTGEIVHDSGKKQSAQSFYQLPEGEKLAWGTRYKWKIRVWDRYDVPSDYSFDQFIMPNRPPNVSNLRPGSKNPENPEGASITPTFKWDFEDLDLEAQVAFQLVVKITDTDAEIYNTGKVSRNVSEHTIPGFVLSHGVSYYAQVTVWDPNGLEGVSEKAYIVTNATPLAPILTTPVNDYRTTLTPVFSGIVGTDAEDDGMHFIIQISENEKFVGEVLTYRSDQDRSGWKVGGFDIPEGGVKNDQAGQVVSYQTQFQLDMNKRYYWKMAAVDAETKAVGIYGETRRIRAGNELSYDTLIHPIATGNLAANRVLVALDYAIASDGSNPADIKVYICNNANDVEPTWEDMTDEFKSMDYYTFQNTEKTSEAFAVALKVEIKANDTMGEIFVASHGFTFD